MPPKRGQNYTERVNKRRRAVDNSATSDSLLQPHVASATSGAGTYKCFPGNNTTYPFGRSTGNVNSISAAAAEALLNVAQPRQSAAAAAATTSSVAYPSPSAAAAATTFLVAYPSPFAAAAAVLEVLFVPDPISLSSSEANPSTTNADPTVLNTVINNPVRQVTSSLQPGAAPQSKNTVNCCATNTSFFDQYGPTSMWTLHYC